MDFTLKLEKWYEDLEFTYFEFRKVLPDTEDLLSGLKMSMRSFHQVMGLRRIYAAKVNKETKEMTAYYYNNIDSMEMRLLTIEEKQQAKKSIRKFEFKKAFSEVENYHGLAKISFVEIESFYMTIEDMLRVQNEFTQKEVKAEQKEFYLYTVLHELKKQKLKPREENYIFNRIKEGVSFAPDSPP